MKDLTKTLVTTVVVPLITLGGGAVLGYSISQGEPVQEPVEVRQEVRQVETVSIDEIDENEIMNQICLEFVSQEGKSQQYNNYLDKRLSEINK